ncbi:hypothetical protein NP493_865g00019 [Ridgeia piscesae]|uniref:Galaxin-like repeats domain-containing protein n=1 Tax=Ridgeia piscesae TaxID=27915 RepID=A0AAD9NKN4_RIDPI|nr:hypothetical protein NP493_865g00019 [Ridgeia piscesae]
MDHFLLAKNEVLNKAARVRVCQSSYKSVNCGHYDMSAYLCCDGQLAAKRTAKADCCGTKTFDPNVQTCCKRVLYEKDASTPCSRHEDHPDYFYYDTYETY